MLLSTSKASTQTVYNILRPYQKKIVDAIINAYESGYSSPLAQAPTGAGKSIIGMALFEYFLNQGKRIGLVVHKEELLSQWVKGFETFFPHYSRSILGNKQKYGKLFHPQANIHLFSVKCLAPRAFKPDIDLLAYDECHHIPAGEWCKSLHDYRNQVPGLKVLGMTATPIRFDGKGLRNLELETKSGEGKKIKIPVDGFDYMAIGPQVSELINDGHLVPVRVFAGRNIAVAEGYSMSGGDFNSGEMSALIEVSVPLHEVVEDWFRLGENRRTVVYPVSVEYSKKLEQEFNKQAPGIAKHIDANTPLDERFNAINDFREGRIRLLLQHSIVVEGVDIPAIDAVVCIRPTASIALWLQVLGRALRPAENKSNMILIDYTDNHIRLPMPEDKIEWSLDGYINHHYYFCFDCNKERRFNMLNEQKFEDHVLRDFECRKCQKSFRKRYDINGGIEKPAPDPYQDALEEKRLARKKYKLTPRPDFYDYYKVYVEDTEDHSPMEKYVIDWHNYRLSRKGVSSVTLQKEVIKAFDREDYTPSYGVFFLLYQCTMGSFINRAELYLEKDILASNNSQWIQAMNRKVKGIHKTYPSLLAKIRRETLMKRFDRLRKDNPDLSDSDVAKMAVKFK